MLMNAPPRPLVSGGACTSFEYGYVRNMSLNMTMITGARHFQMPLYTQCAYIPLLHTRTQVCIHTSAIAMI